ncbi:MAG TPA: DUF433 domain-containing protein [Stellaceae bacterium]|nr:DUF433 domain-containing protein [Stellaceae bacterium]
MNFSMQSQNLTLFTPAEAAVLSQQSLKAVNNAIDKKTVAAQRRGGSRVLDEQAVVYLALERDLSRDTTPAFRRRLSAEIASSPRRRVVTVGALMLDLRAPRREIKERIAQLRRAARLVTVDPETMGGQPVFRGTRVPVHLIAELLRLGETPERLLVDYPRITAEMVRLAPIYATAHPQRGRPLKQPWHDQEPIAVWRLPLTGPDAP